MEVAAILVLSVVALSGAAYAYYWYSPTPVVPHLSTAVQRSTMRVGERERTYLAYVPANLPPKSALVIVLHGSGMDGTKGCESARVTEAEQAIDDKQVYVFGYSNGGHMAFRLAMEAPEAIAAVTAVAASLPTPDASSCPQHGRTSRVILVNGTDDPVSPYQGGVVRLFGLASSRGTVLSAKASARTLAERNGIKVAPVAARLPTGRPDDPTSVETLVWSADGKPICCLYSVHGGGHVIPQRAFRFPRLLGRTTSALNAPSVALSFFEGNLSE
jgi:polyhydroxybutyrate depolymerase